MGSVSNVILTFQKCVLLLQFSLADNLDSRKKFRDTYTYIRTRGYRIYELSIG